MNSITSSTTGNHRELSSFDFMKMKPYTPPSWATHLHPIPSHTFSLGHFPTPIHKWNLPNLPKNTEVWLKRDDLSGMQLSGNKVRKLEFLLADAVAQGANCIITIGGIQSNHCRATAVAAKYLNLDCYLILRTSKVLVDKDPGLTGNLLVERLVGAHIDLVSKEEYSKIGSETLTNLLKEKLVNEGRRPYVIPVGGSNSLGTCLTGQVVGVSTYAESITVSHSLTTEEKVGVLLLNLGGPDTLNDVQPFLFNLFADPDIIRLPRPFRFLQKPLAQLISVLRAPKSKEGYASIGGGSPLRKITYEQAEALRIALEAKKLPVNIYVGMRYWYPFTEEAIQQIKNEGITRLVVLPLYPQFSISTTGSSIRVLQNIFKEDSYLSRLPTSIIRYWYQREGYLKSMADLIEKELNNFTKPEEVKIFFSAHGVPVSYVEEAGDPYRDQMEECISLIMRELNSRGIANDHILAYQSRVGPVQWLQPYTDKVLVELGQQGLKSLLAVPVSFVSEHIETLEEIDMEYKELALESGIQNWGRVPALGCTSSFINDLADAVIEALPSATTISSSEGSNKVAVHNQVSDAVKAFFDPISAVLFSQKNE